MAVRLPVATPCSQVNCLSQQPSLPTGSGGSGLLSGLLSPVSAGSGRTANASAPGRHRLATEGAAGTPGSGAGGSGNSSARGLSSEALSRLFSSPTSEADLFSALQVCRVGRVSQCWAAAHRHSVQSAFAELVVLRHPSWHADAVLPSFSCHSCSGWTRCLPNSWPSWQPWRQHPLRLGRLEAQPPTEAAAAGRATMPERRRPTPLGLSGLCGATTAAMAATRHRLMVHLQPHGHLKGVPGRSVGQRCDALLDNLCAVCMPAVPRHACMVNDKLV